eukprot:TRINITY_DN8225_c0_g1_i13.p1 TRINITY_DN8225_c0_g1~~TRINITY_DN8225_c0_g1_i13.p1  ORF type:complete len:500 (-),score=67.27 TRINITY_DN8225_c0_g1_i13:306-1805(-)
MLLAKSIGAGVSKSCQRQSMGLLRPERLLCTSDNSFVNEPLDNMFRLTSDLVDETVPASISRVCQEYQVNYRSLHSGEEIKYLLGLAPQTKTNKVAVSSTVEKYLKNYQSSEGKAGKLEDELRKILEPPIHKLFSRIGQTRGGVKFLVDMRKDVITAMKGLDKSSTEFKNLQELSKNLKDLLSMWISVGFMSTQRVTWDSPSSLLQKISEYEAVHPLRNWTDLKNRVGPYRRVFVYTHPCMEGEPLVVLHVALTKQISNSMSDVLKDPRSVRNVARHPVPEQAYLDQEEDLESVDTAIFYSITSTQSGLQGIELGTHLIKQAVALLKREIPWLSQFSTLSPIPGFRSWLLLELTRHLKEGTPSPLSQAEVQALSEICCGNENESSVEKGFHGLIKSGQWSSDQQTVDTLKPVLLRLCARYLYEEKRRSKALDPVANFHIRNGAMLYRINWMADPSPRGMGNSCGIMVNYRYYLENLEENSREYINNNVLPVNQQVLDLL